MKSNAKLKGYKELRTKFKKKNHFLVILMNLVNPQNSWPGSCTYHNEITWLDNIIFLYIVKDLISIIQIHNYKIIELKRPKCPQI